MTLMPLSLAHCIRSLNVRGDHWVRMASYWLRTPRMFESSLSLFSRL